MNKIAEFRPGTTGLLASVTCAEEAAVALAGRADIIDLKNPSAGALGALDAEVLRAIVQQVGGRVPVSATVGDLVAMVPGELVAAARRVAACGVDYVKIGFFPTATPGACIDALASLARQGTRLIAVMFADLGYEQFSLRHFADAGFAGVMLDTATKGQGSIRRWRTDSALASFVAEGHACGLLTGLAGSLGLADIAPLQALGPDYLGFRGALCAAGQRTAQLDAAALARVRAALDDAVAANASVSVAANGALAGARAA